MRILVVDDEPHARKTIVSLLRRDDPTLGPIEEADGVVSARKKLLGDAFDLVLLDIHMRDGSAFDLLKGLPTQQFQLIFITAYSEYALQAFRFAALDYVLKPINRNELADAVSRARSQVGLLSNQIKLAALSQNLKGDRSLRLVLSSTDEILLAPVDEIEYLEAQVNYTNVVLTDGKKVLQSRTLKEFEKLLENHGFYRIHRSYLINLDRLASLSRSGKEVRLKSGIALPMSPVRKDRLLEEVNIAR